MSKKKLLREYKKFQKSGNNQKNLSLKEFKKQMADLIIIKK